MCVCVKSQDFIYCSIEENVRPWRRLYARVCIQKTIPSHTDALENGLGTRGKRSLVLATPKKNCLKELYFKYVVSLLRMLDPVFYPVRCYLCLILSNINDRGEYFAGVIYQNKLSPA